ncbi:hypothetical protein PAHAL_7G329800 [Panicum hallii]|uniref:HMA domain-containing protein n=2 Tax=Panicum hallii TaxID=206008 RepID=A0A2S3IC39_9POAL|nr:heavy metal-associated isoprenylated plant protein 39-like isoform X1 [Panicum hallii]PAN40637.1 hypothetical protein PAHAL_7G329800 [Panicum hallii]
MAMAAKTVVLLLGLHENDAKEKRKVLKAVSTFPGLDLIAIDMKECKLTVVGLVDPIELVTKLRKLWHADILSVGPAKDDKAAAAAAAAAWNHRDGGGGVKEEGDKGHQVQEVTPAKQVERPADDMRSWPHAVVYPPRDPPPYPHPHQYVAGGHGAQENYRHNGAYYVAGGRGAPENHPHNGAYVAGGRGAREHLPNSYPYVARGYGAQENPPNACAIC